MQPQPKRADESNDERKRHFIFAHVGWPASHPRHSPGERPLTTLEAFSGKDDETREWLFPDSHARQDRFARLSADLILQATVQAALEGGVSFNRLLTENLIHLPTDCTIPRLKEKWHETGRNAYVFTNWLVDEGAVRRIEDDPQYREKEMAHPRQKREIVARKMATPNLTDPIPMHPWQAFVEGQDLIREYFQLAVPEAKHQSGAQEARIRKGSDETVRKVTEPLANASKDESPTSKKTREEVKYLAVGSLPDINRLSVLPLSPRLAEIFFERLNFHKRTEKTVDWSIDRADFHRSPLKMGPHGLHDQKNYVALTEDVTPAAQARGIKGTIAELAVMSPQMFAAKSITAAIYQAQKRFEADNHKFTTERITLDDLRSLKKDYHRFVEPMQDTIRLNKRATPEQKKTLLGMLQPENPIGRYLNRIAQLEEEEPKEWFEQAMDAVFVDLSTMQRITHVLGAVNSSAEWRTCWLKDALRMNQEIAEQAPARRTVAPMQEIFFEMVADSDIDLPALRQESARGRGAGNPPARGSSH